MSEEIKIFCLLDNKLFKINHFKFAQRAKGNHVQRIKGNWEKCCVKKMSVSIETEITKRSQIQILELKSKKLK